MQLMDRTFHTTDRLPSGPDVESERQDGKPTMAPEPAQPPQTPEKKRTLFETVLTSTPVILQIPWFG